jgi:hypothetical protein
LENTFSEIECQEKNKKAVPRGLKWTTGNEGKGEAGWIPGSQPILWPMGDFDYEALGPSPSFGAEPRLAPIASRARTTRRPILPLPHEGEGQDGGILFA